MSEFESSNDPRILTLRHAAYVEDNQRRVQPTFDDSEDFRPNFPQPEVKNTSVISERDAHALEVGLPPDSYPFVKTLADPYVKRTQRFIDEVKEHPFRKTKELLWTKRPYKTLLGAAAILSYETFYSIGESHSHVEVTPGTTITGLAAIALGTLGVINLARENQRREGADAPRHQNDEPSRKIISRD